jgi:hypothetical protein
VIFVCAFHNADLTTLDNYMDIQCGRYARNIGACLGVTRRDYKISFLVIISKFRNEYSHKSLHIWGKDMLIIFHDPKVKPQILIIYIFVIVE